MSSPATVPPFARAGVVGLGVIGGSVALGIRAAWPTITIVGVDEQRITEAALARGVIDESRDSIRALDLDLIVLATPVAAILEAVEELGRAGISTTVTDVGSTKRRVLETAASAGLVNFVGGHPMAGSERAGLEAARADLFAGRPWFLAPAVTASSEARGRVTSLVRALDAEPVPLAPDAHDRTMAYVSHLPQLVATWLMVTGGEAIGEGGLKYSGRGFDEMTRLAASSAGVWESIVTTNADYIAEAMRSLLAKFPTTIGTDSSALRDFFARANHWRARLDEERRSAH
jgi:prephenate dehydrogenase